jgi:hypothetical protein
VNFAVVVEASHHRLATSCLAAGLRSVAALQAGHVSKSNISDGNRCTDCEFRGAGGTNGLLPSLKGQPKKASCKNAPRHGFARRIEKID